MKWKKGLPTAPGWYWRRQASRWLKGEEVEVTMVRVRNYAGALAIDNSYLQGWKSMEGAEWAGPIPEPGTPPHPILVEMLQGIRDTAAHKASTCGLRDLSEKLSACREMAKTTLELIRNGEI